MRLQIKAQHEDLPDGVRAYAEKRLRKLDRRLHDLTHVEVTLSRAHNPSIHDDHTADGIVHTKGPTVVARESALTYEAAIDRLVDKLERQVERYRDKRTHEPRRTVQKRELAPGPIEGLDGELASGPEESAA
jgi:putative sigma-54 modulation protein